MHVKARNRALHHYGQPFARLNRDQSVHENLEKRQFERSIPFLLLLPFCFYLPDIYIGQLEQLWVDYLVNYVPWNAFISQLKNDWDSLAVPATVILTVNWNILAVQSIDIAKAERSVAQIACYCSVVFSICSIVLILILSHQHRDNGVNANMESAVSFNV